MDEERPESSLWLAVVEQALEDGRGEHGPKLQRRAWSWLASKAVHPGRFEWICFALDLDAPGLRRVIAEQRKKGPKMRHPERRPRITREEYLENLT